MGLQIDTATVEGSMELPQKITNGTALWSMILLLGIYPKKTWNTNSKEYMHPYVHCSVIYNCQDLETTQVTWSGEHTIQCTDDVL